MLRMLGIEVFGFVRGGRPDPAAMGDFQVGEDNWRALRELRDASEVYLPDAAASGAMIASIRQAKIGKDTVGGFVEVHVFGCPPGLGKARWSDRLDTRLTFAVMGIRRSRRSRSISASNAAVTTDRRATDRLRRGSARWAASRSFAIAAPGGPKAA